MLSILLAPVAIGQAGPPPFPREFRAAWVATVDNIDWPSKPGLPVSQQKAEMRRIVQLAAGMRLNALILQVRTSADSLYNSPIEPWSEFLTGRQGRAPQPLYDPLEFAIQECRARGMELHVWINPYRAFHPAQDGPVAANHISRTNPKAVVDYGRFKWMDPGQTVVQQRTLAVARDIVRRYDIDGFHIDDYFYPYPVANTPFPDQATYQAYRARGGTLSLADWRRRNVDVFVQDLHKTIKQEKSWVKFGISPFGIYRPGIPAGIRAGVDQYGELYADAKKWLEEGWCDYFTPQLYWPIRQTAQSYTTLLDWWMSVNPKRLHIWPGQFTSRTNPADGNWRASEIVEQIRETRERNAGGNVHFSMKAFLRNWNGVTDAVRGQVYQSVALPPAFPWLDSDPPGAPTSPRRDGNVYRWTASDPGDTRNFAVWRRYGSNWISLLVPGDKLEYQPMAGDVPLRELWVAAVDRAGNLSPWVRAEIR